MRRILAISMAVAIPAVLPMNASDARVKPKPQATSAHGKVVHTGHAAHRRPGRSESSHGRPQNDVQVSSDDPGNEGGQGAPEGAEAPGAHGAPATAPGSASEHEAHGKPGRATPHKHSTSQARPSTGPDTGFSIPDDVDMSGDMDGMSVPPEAAEVIKSIGTRNAPEPVAPVTTGQVVKPVPAKPGQAKPGRPVMGGKPAQAAPARQGKSIVPAAARIGDSSAGATRLTLRTSTGAGHSVMLRCDPPGGSHPNAAQACEDVAKSNGDLQQLPANANPRACFMIYAPVTVSAQGDWHGQPMRFRAQYPNTCVMRDKTGAIFDF